MSIKKPMNDALLGDKGEGVGGSLPSGWEKVRLGDVLIFQRGLDLPSKNRKTGKHPVIASTGVVGSHSHAPVKAPGVVIGRSGSIGGGQYIIKDFWRRIQE